MELWEREKVICIEQRRKFFVVLFATKFYTVLILLDFSTFRGPLITPTYGRFIATTRQLWDFWFSCHLLNRGGSSPWRYRFIFYPSFSKELFYMGRKRGRKELHDPLNFNESLVGSKERVTISTLFCTTFNFQWKISKLKLY